MTRHLLVTTNNFWVGGRETYVATYLRTLAQRGVSADLLCSSVQSGLPETEVFCSMGVAQGDGERVRLRSWLEVGGRLVDGRRPALVWAQHFELLPAWLLALQHGLPLLVTFHGPLAGAGRPNEALEALGMVLAIHRGGHFSGVSPEVCAQLERLTGRAAMLLPNVVAPAEGRSERTGAWPPRRWLLVTRQEKLGHLRAALQFFAAYRDRVPGSRLVIVSSSTPVANSSAAGPLANLRRGLESLGYRWCRSEGPSLWRALLATHWAGYSPAPRAEMRAADLVLGMGRVVLEALSEGRPALVVGYEQLHGLVAEERWEELARSNFSGRGVPFRDVALCVRDLTTPSPPRAPLPERFAPEEPAGRVLALASGGAPTPVPRSDLDLAQELSELLRGGAESGVIFRRAAARLSEQEWESFFHLSRG